MRPSFHEYSPCSAQLVKKKKTHRRFARNAASTGYLINSPAQQIRIFTPYTNLHPETIKALQPHNPTLVDCSASPWSYLNYLQTRWNDGQAFINVEHDVIPRPGAIDQIAECPHDWCYYSYQGWTGVAPFGLVKFSASFIAQTRDMWDERRRSLEEDGPRWWPQWCFLDTYAWAYARQQLKIPAHQHTPPVGHRN